MKGVFDFLSMAGNYGARKVGRYDEGDVFVSTVMVTDSNQPYETAVSHPEYNDGDIVIVEQYDTKGKAKVGHDKWVAAMTADILPAALTDVSGATASQLLDLFPDEVDETNWRIRPRIRR